MNKSVGLAVLQRDAEKYAKQVSKGHSFVVTKRLKPLFKIVAVDEESDAVKTILRAHQELIDGKEIRGDFREILKRK